ncbi:protein TOPLESS [Populus alba]|uniref:protein TOPLESS n=1 Tax=Populus alba TaxID=43335 RepID=UPI00158DFA9D|nr:protein TOPLESS-like [Populus alba]
MSPLHKDLLSTILQFLKYENLQDTAHALERETGIFFDAKHFEIMVLGGKFDEAEKYISGFTDMHENLDSTRIFFELRKQKFLEALDRKDRPKALDVLTKELQDFSRKHRTLRSYGDPKIERIHVMNALKTFISDNPAFKGKMDPPTGRNASLLRLLVRGDLDGSTSMTRDFTFSGRS